MLEFIAHDTTNDIALIKTTFCFNVRYGLQIESFSDIHEAMKAFADCQNHALNCAGHFD